MHIVCVHQFYFHFTHTQPFTALWILSGTIRVTGYLKKHLSTHTPSWSSIIPYLLCPSITIRGIFPVQFTCLTVFFHNLKVFFGLPLRLAPSTSFSIHFFYGHYRTLIVSHSLPVKSNHWFASPLTESAQNCFCDFGFSTAMHLLPAFWYCFKMTECIIKYAALCCTVRIIVV